MKVYNFFLYTDDDIQSIAQIYANDRIMAALYLIIISGIKENDFHYINEEKSSEPITWENESQTIKNN